MTKGDLYARALTAEYYDRVHPYANRADIDFYIGLAAGTGGPVMELGCGTGRVLIPTARLGVEITGVDASAHMLAVCRQKLALEDHDVRRQTRLVEGDMTDLRLDSRFALVTIPFRPFQHLIGVEEQLACLDVAFRHLVSGGLLALDVFDPDVAKLVGSDSEGDAEDPFSMPDGRTVTRTHRNASIDLHRQVIGAEIVYCVTHPDDRLERLVAAFPLRYFFRYELEHLLARAGFHVEAVYGDFDRSPPGSGRSRELIFVARKP